MQNYTNITEDKSLTESRQLLLDNFLTIASDYSGTTFPTTDLVVGMWCWRTDQNKLYQLTALPGTWTLRFDFSRNLAYLDSPVFTGDPTAPTPALGDRDTSIATTLFVQDTLAKRLVKGVTGGTVTLTAAEAGNGVLDFTGALTSNCTVVVPTAGARWIVENATTGAFTLTVKTSAGTGVVVTQGKQLEVYCDGTNVMSVKNDYKAIALDQPSITSFREAQVSATMPVGTYTLDCSRSNFFALTFGAGNATLAFSNVPATGNVYSCTLRLQQDATGNRQLTFPAAVKHASGVAPVLSGANKTDFLTLLTTDGGVTWFCFPGGRNF